MHVEEGLLDLGPEALDHGVAEGEVGHEVAVHHVLEKKTRKIVVTTSSIHLVTLYT